MPALVSGAGLIGWVLWVFGLARALVPAVLFVASVAADSSETWLYYSPDSDTSPPPAAAPSYGAQLSEAEMDALLERIGWPADLREDAKGVAFCESRFRPGAESPGGYRGLFQIGPYPWAAYAGVDPGRLFDPVINAQVALLIRQYEDDRGEPAWSNWSCKPWYGR